jgi:hypothetical protein
MKCIRLGLPAVAMLLVTAASAIAQNPEKQETDPLKVVLKRLEDMEKGISESFRNMRDDITKLQMEALRCHITGEKVLRLEDQLKKMQGEIDDMRRESPPRQSFSIDPNKKQIIAADLEDIRSRLLSMEQLLRTQPRVSYSAPVAVTSRLQLVNNYPEFLDFVVNGVSYAVPPGEMRTVENVPAGMLNYFVVSRIWGARGAQSRNLVPGETFVITAR